MVGAISSIKLCQSDNGIYWLLRIVDENNNEIGTFGTPINCDSINFRYQTFGIMSVLKNFDLFNLTGKRINASILFKSKPTRVLGIKNDNGDFLSIDDDAKISCGNDLDMTGYENANLSSLVSTSGILATRIDSRYYGQFFQAPHVYLGFKPVYEYANNDTDIEVYGANYFSMFISQLLKICQVEDLIPMDTKISEYPKVSVLLDENNCIKAIGDLEQKHWLVDTGDEYILSDNPNNTKRKQ